MITTNPIDCERCGERIADEAMVLFHQCRPDGMKAFLDQIKRFNETYKIPSNDKPTYLGYERIRQFVSIVSDELAEGYDIADADEEATRNGPEPGEEDALVAMADLLADIIVYCASEARRWGLPIEPILARVMESNFSKLDENGEPIINGLGKVCKGPGFVPPEPAIKKIIEEASR